MVGKQVIINDDHLNKFYCIMRRKKKGFLKIFCILPDGGQIESRDSSSTIVNNVWFVCSKGRRWLFIKSLQSVVERRVVIKADWFGKYLLSSWENLFENFSYEEKNGDVDVNVSSEDDKWFNVDDDDGGGGGGGSGGGFNRWYRLAVAYISFVQLCRRFDIIFHFDGCCCCLLAASICNKSRSSDNGGSMADDDECVELNMRSSLSTRSVEVELAGGDEVSKTMIDGEYLI